jgi:hypothetical protein
METLRPSREWEILRQPFEACFTKPTYQLLRAFVWALAHLDQRLWITQVILTAGLQRHWTGLPRFLSRAGWSVEAVRQELLALCLPRCLDAKQRLLVGLDDTVAAKTGRHFAGAGLQHDPMNRAPPQRLSWGHCFVCLALLAQAVPNHDGALF